MEHACSANAPGSSIVCTLYQWPSSDIGGKEDRANDFSENIIHQDPLGGTPRRLWLAGADI